MSEVVPSPSSLAPVPAPGTIEYVDRCDQLGDLEACIAKHRKVLVRGIPGIGKTELTGQYCRRNRDAYSGNICWINSEEPFPEITLRNFLCRVVPGDVNFSDDVPVTTQILNYWEHWPCHKFLLVFDNLTRSKDISFLLPPPGDWFHCLVTSNSMRQLSLFRGFDVAPLEPADAFELLRHRLGDEVDNDPAFYMQLCRRVHYHPDCVHRIASVFLEEEAR